MAKIVYDHAGEHGEQEICADKPNFFMGRHPGNDLVVDHLGVSRYHAAIFRQGEDYWIVSYGPNGTLYNPGEARFSSEHFIEDVRATKTYCQLKKIAEREMADAIVAQMRGAAAELMKDQPEAVATIGLGVSVPRTEVRDIDIIKNILGNSLRAKMLSCEAKKLEDRSFIAMPAVRHMNNMSVFQVLF